MSRVEATRVSRLHAFLPIVGDAVPASAMGLSELATAMDIVVDDIAAYAFIGDGLEMTEVARGHSLTFAVVVVEEPNGAVAV